MCSCKIAVFSILIPGTLIHLQHHPHLALTLSFKSGYVSIKLPRGDIEKVLHSIDHPQIDTTEHTTVSNEVGSVNSDPTKMKCKDIVPGLSEEEIFGVVHTSYKETHV